MGWFGGQHSEPHLFVFLVSFLFSHSFSMNLLFGCSVFHQSPFRWISCLAALSSINLLFDESPVWLLCLPSISFSMNLLFGCSVFHQCCPWIWWWVISILLFTVNTSCANLFSFVIFHLPVALSDSISGWTVVWMDRHIWSVLLFEAAAAGKHTHLFNF